MVKKTIINRTCKRVINTSDDANILVYQEAEIEAEELVTHEEIESNANSVEFGEVPEMVEVTQTGEKMNAYTGEISVERYTSRSICC